MGFTNYHGEILRTDQLCYKKCGRYANCSNQALLSCNREDGHDENAAAYLGRYTRSVAKCQSMNEKKDDEKKEV